MIHQRQRDAAALLADIAAKKEPAVGEMLLQPLEVHAVDDLRILRILAGRCCVKPVVRFTDAGEKFVSDAPLNEEIVRRGKGLPGGTQLGCGDPVRGAAEIGARIHDAGRLPADICDDGRELCRRRTADDARRRAAAGEINHTQRLAADGADCFEGVRPCGDVFAVEVAVKQRCQQF